MRSDGLDTLSAPPEMFGAVLRKSNLLIRPKVRDLASSPKQQDQQKYGQKQQPHQNWYKTYIIESFGGLYVMLNHPDDCKIYCMLRIIGL